MRFKLEFTFDISDSSLLIDAIKLFHDKMKEICND